MNESTIPYPHAVLVPSKTKFEPRTVEVIAPSGRKYTLRELTGYEQMQVDSGAESVQQSMYYRMAMAIEAVDDEKIRERVKRDHVDILLKSISGQDADFLVVEFAKAFSPLAQAEDIKNSPAPSD